MGEKYLSCLDEQAAPNNENRTSECFDEAQELFDSEDFDDLAVLDEVLDADESDFVVGEVVDSDELGDIFDEEEFDWDEDADCSRDFNDVSKEEN